MALMIKKPIPVERPPEQKTNNVVVEDIPYRSNITDTRYTPYKNLLTHITGSSWIVNYYQQMLGANSEPSPQQIGLDPVYQQYREISELELKVSSPLSQSQDSESKEFEVTGEATLYPPIIPNKGDMFVADIGDGRAAVFTITEVTRLSILKETCYGISYILVDYADSARLGDLSLKTIERTTFVKKLLEHGDDPILVNEDYNLYLQLASKKDSLIGAYFGEFFNRSINSLSVPDQRLITYDPFLAKFIKSFMDNTEHPILKTMKIYSVEIPGEDLPSTLWDSFLMMSDTLLPMASTKLALLDSKLFGNIGQYGGVYFTEVRSVVYPVEVGSLKLLNTKIGPGKASKRDIVHQFETTLLGELQSVVEQPTDGIGIDSLVTIKLVTHDDNYVFSNAFYTGDRENQSQLETLVSDALSGKAVNQRVLLNLIKLAPKWRRLEKFYYIPILLILIKLVRRGL